MTSLLEFPHDGQVNVESKTILVMQKAHGRRISLLCEFKYESMYPVVTTGSSA